MFKFSVIFSVTNDRRDKHFLDNSYETHTYKIEVPLYSLKGMFIKNVMGLTESKWNVATATNPFIDGDIVNNKIAEPKEITIVFGFDLTIPVKKAKDVLLNELSKSGALSSNLENSQLVLKWEKNGEAKYLDSIITDVSLPRNTQIPELSITFHSDSFWYGDEIEIEGKLSEEDSTQFIFDLGIPKGNTLAAVKMNYEFTVIESEDGRKEIPIMRFALINNEVHPNLSKNERLLIDEIVFGFFMDSRIPPNYDPKWLADFKVIEFCTEKGNKYLKGLAKKKYNTHTAVIDEWNSLNSVIDGRFFSVIPNMKQLIICQCMLPSEDINHPETFLDQTDLKPKGKLTYVPLYI